MIELALNHMVELHAETSEETAIKVGVFEKFIGQVSPTDGVSYYCKYWQNLMFSITQDAGRLFERKLLAA
ncbi:MAG: hypothetical protein WB715_11550 [Roseiarcus sp.]|uniref:hypothetical protein n=1 Tax=Roseiarcus sp. TaxID=1969460 RepID=UPI003C4899D7